MQNDLPSGIKNKVSPYIVGCVERRELIIGFGMAMSIVCIFGPIVGHPDHNGVRYLMAPFIMPYVPAIYLTLRPFRPFRGIPFVTGTWDVDTSDTEVMRLVELYRSEAAKRFVWRSAVKLSVILLCSMVVLGVLVRNSLEWSFWSSWTWQGMVGCCLFSGIVLAHEYIAWGFRAWAASQQH